MGEGKLLIEKRQHQRLELSFPVSYRFAKRDAAMRRTKKGKSADLSRSGIRLVAAESIAPGSVLLLEIIPPHGIAPIKGKACVVWRKKTASKEDGSQEYHMGLKLVNIDDTGNDLISHSIVESIKRISKLP